MKRGISIVLVVIFILVVVSGCGDDGKIRVPKSASECKGKDYLDVKALFESAGFTNVNVRAIEDLVTGWITKDGSVERVSINGDDDFGSSSKFDPAVEVVVMYHTFPRNPIQRLHRLSKKRKKPMKQLMRQYRNL